MRLFRRDEEHVAIGVAGTWSPFLRLVTFALTISLNVHSIRLDVEIAPLCWGLQLFWSKFSGSFIIGPVRFGYMEWRIGE